MSPEQLQLVRLVALGWTDQRIGRELSLSVATVQRRLRVVADALKADSRVSLAMRAVALGLIDPTAVGRERVAQQTPEESDAN